MALVACDPGLPPSRDAPTPPSRDAPGAPSTEAPGRPTAPDAPGPGDPARRPSTPPPPPQQADAASTQCVQGETHLYSCPMDQDRTVSVCAGNRQVSYRYGPLGDPEIDLRVAAGRPGLWAGGQSQPHLRFRTGAYDYVVYSGRDATGVERSGVTVLRDGEAVRRLRCPVTSSQTEIPVGMIPDYVLREPAGARADDWF